jgi:hypothetical protein
VENQRIQVDWGLLAKYHAELERSEGEESWGGASPATLDSSPSSLSSRIEGPEDEREIILSDTFI